jgi:hypothetical protein
LPVFRAFHLGETGRPARSPAPAGLGSAGVTSRVVKDSRLHYVNNFVGMLEQKIVATEALPVGDNLIVSATWGFTGGNIHFAAVDVSDEPYVDLERNRLCLARRC